MRLIDADLLRAEFTGNFREMWHYTGIWAMIDCAPTAYDIDETVEQLEKEKEYQKKNAIDKNFRIGVVNGLNAAIRIVKGGAE